MSDINEIICHVCKQFKGINANCRACTSPWISVEDRLPELNVSVLAYADEFGHFVGWMESPFDDGERYWKWGPEGSLGEFIALVKYWAPLPKLPG